MTPDLFGTDGPLGDSWSGPVFDIDVTVPTAANNLPVLLLNDLRWTAD